MLGHRPSAGTIAAALLGALGVALLAASPADALDAIGVAAALGASVAMGTGTVLLKRWSQLAPPLALAGWQLVLGGLALAPVALALEGLPPSPSLANVAGLVLLVTVGTAFAFALWIRGVAVLGEDAAFLGLLSPLVAAALGALLLREWLRGPQLAGAVLVLLAAAGGAAAGRGRPRSSRSIADARSVPGEEP